MGITVYKIHEKLSKLSPLIRNRSCKKSQGQFPCWFCTFFQLTFSLFESTHTWYWIFWKKTLWVGIIRSDVPFSFGTYYLLVAGCWHWSIVSVKLKFAYRLFCRRTDKRYIENFTFLYRLHFYRQINYL